MTDERKRTRAAAEGERWVQVRISKKAYSRLQAWAHAKGTSVSYLMRRLADRALDQDEDEKGIMP